MQQLSPFAPQSVVPIVLTAQLGGAAHTPSTHAGVGQSQATPAPH
jgi:hypothetical protein